MSAIASQVLLHPTVSQSLKLWSTTVGREKTYRAIQYFARFFAWYLLTRGDKDQAARWNALKSALGSGRKLMSLFKPIEHLQAALRTSHLTPSSKAPRDEHLAVIFRQLCLAGYLTFDMLVWANNIKFLTFAPERAAKINRVSQRFWLAGILFSIAAGALKGQRLLSQTRTLKQATSEKDSIGDETEKKVKLRTLAIERGAVRYQLIQDLLDVWLPASGLGYVQVNEGVAGILGTITSLMSLKVAWASAALPPAAK